MMARRTSSSTDRPDIRLQPTRRTLGDGSRDKSGGVHIRAAKMVVRVSQPSPTSGPPEPPFATGGTGVADPQPVAAMHGGRAQLWRIAAALTYRDFRVLWLGACTSSIGTWMQRVAQSWLVLELTDSAWYLALDSFVGEAPLL